MSPFALCSSFVRQRIIHHASYLKQAASEASDDEDEEEPPKAPGNFCVDCQLGGVLHCLAATTCNENP